jgi:hypothetical protein
MIPGGVTITLGSVGLIQDLSDGLGELNIPSVHILLIVASPMSQHTPQIGRVHGLRFYAGLRNETNEHAVQPTCGRRISSVEGLNGAGSGALGRMSMCM